MWPRRNIILGILFYLMILATLAKGDGNAETTTDSIANDPVLAENLNIENDVIGEDITVSTVTTESEVTNGDKESGIVGETADNVESETASPTATESTNNEETEPASNGQPSTEPNTDADLNNNTESESVTESTTDQIDCVCDCLSNGNQVTLECSTQVAKDTQTEQSENADNETSSTSNSNSLEPETTNSSNVDETSAKSNDNPDTTTESKTPEETTSSLDTNENQETSTIPAETTTPLPVCSTPGVQPHVSDCQQYYDCSAEGSLDGSFHLLTKSCPDKQAFNNELNRCSRDISSCSLTISCQVKGGLADSSSNSSYYLCEPRLIGGGFHIFHVDCSANEIFYPELGKCFVDLNNLPSQIYPPYNWNQMQDIDIVKAEMKLLKEQDKLKLKQEKDRKKAEEKLQKQLDKEAKKRAKEEQKLNKEKAKEESTSFVCVQEGNFESSVGDSTYYACITKKGKLKALVMQCPIGSKFNSESGTCLNNLSNGNNTDADDDDDEDDD